MTATVVIKDRFSNTVLNKVIEPASIQRAANKFSVQYPDCWVNVKSVQDPLGDFCFLQPLNMSRDEDSEMTLQEYQSYWYPGLDLQDTPPLEVEKELESEYLIDEHAPEVDECDIDVYEDEEDIDQDEAQDYFPY